jgi:hypothetical protein
VNTLFVLAAFAGGRTKAAGLQIASFGRLRLIRKIAYGHR